jgi:hypothetical protein
MERSGKKRKREEKEKDKNDEDTVGSIAQWYNICLACTRSCI